MRNFRRKKIEFSTNRRKRRISRSKKSSVWKVVIVLLVIVLSFLILGFLSFLMMISYFSRDLPDISNLSNFLLNQSSTIYDREGNELYTIHGEENRKYISLSEIPDHFQKAIIAFEDDDFWHHEGFDLGGIAKAVCYEALNNRYADKILGKGTRTVGGFCPKRGGSTITQQLVKKIYLSKKYDVTKRSYERKIIELILAYNLEKTYSKEKILEIYLNTVPFGSNAYGIEKAAKTFFGKKAKELSLAESVILAGLPNAPTKYSPYNNREALMGYFDTKTQKSVRGQKDKVLKRMEAVGYLTPEETKNAWLESSQIEFKPYLEEMKYPHFVNFVKEQLEESSEVNLKVSGNKIFTTINPIFQDLAEQIISEKKEDIFKKCDATNAGLLAIDPQKGQILAMVGSADFYNLENQGEVNIATSLRQPGSSFKPIVYTAAFIKGYSPGTVIFDVETNFATDGESYIPQNFDNEFRGPVTLRTSLQNSLNIPAVKMSFLAGIKDIIELAGKMGYSTFKDDPDYYGVSIGLGTGEVKMIEHVSSFGILANKGKKIPLTPFLRTEDVKGEVVAKWEQEEGEEIVDEKVAYLISHVLSDTGSRPAYWNKYLSIPNRIVAAKTGTSNRRYEDKENLVLPSDNWVIGYVPNFVVGVWVGNFDGKPLNPKSTGLECAGPIFHEFFKESLKHLEEEKFTRPEGIKEVEIDKLSGLLPSEKTKDEEKITDIFIEDNVPKEVSATYKEVKIDKVSGLLATDFTPPESVETKIYIDLHSHRPEDTNWEEPVQKWFEAFYEKENEGKEEKEKIFVNPPEEEDNIHSAERSVSAPQLEIKFPRDKGTVGHEKFEVQLEIKVPNSMSFIEYFWDENLLEKIEQPPFEKHTFYIPENTEKGSFHKFTVKVVDKFFYSVSQQIEIKVEEDKVKPEIKIIRPAKGETISQGSSYFVQTDIQDEKSGISRVDFFIDGINYKTLHQEPFNVAINFDVDAGEHNFSVRAVDGAQNVSLKSMKVAVVVDSNREVFTETKVVSPEHEASFSMGEKIKITAQIAEKDLKKAKKIIINAKSNIWFKVAEFDRTNNGHFEAIFYPESPGTYQIYVKVVTENSSSIISDKISIHVR